MKVLFVGLVTSLVFIGCMGFRQAGSELRQCVLGYSNYYEGKQDSYDPNAAGAFINDKKEFVWFDKGVGQLEGRGIIDTMIVNGDTTYRGRAIYEWPESDLPFRFQRKGKFIYALYRDGDKMYNEVQYSLDNRDTTRCILFREVCNTTGVSPIKGKAFFRGKKVILNLAGRKFKCYVFEEYYVDGPRTAPGKKVITFLDLKNLIPVRIEYTLYPDKTFKNKTRGTSISQLSFILTDTNAYFLRKVILPGCD